MYKCFVSMETNNLHKLVNSVKNLLNYVSKHLDGITWFLTLSTGHKFNSYAVGSQRAVATCHSMC